MCETCFTQWAVSNEANTGMMKDLRPFGITLFCLASQRVKMSGQCYQGFLTASVRL